jgi:hypothetical protein
MSCARASRTDAIDALVAPLGDNQRMDVAKGMRFRSAYADSNALWEVKSHSGGGVWQCEIVDEPFEIDGRTFSGDYAGVVQPFNARAISAAVAREQSMQAHFDAADDWFAGRELGETVHYCDGFGQFVRCEVVIGNEQNLDAYNADSLMGQKVLQPVALVGDWNEPVKRDLDGSVRPGYHAQKILEGTGAWRPSTTCVYEAPDCSEQYRAEGKVDPRTLEPVSLQVPELTEHEKRQAMKWAQVQAVRDAVSAGQDPDQILASVRRELQDDSLGL